MVNHSAMQEMLSRLRSGHGHWYDLAQYVPQLAEAGYDAATLENETGLERPRQNVWVVAAQVLTECSADSAPWTVSYL